MITLNADPRIEQLTVLVRQLLLIGAPVAAYEGWAHLAGLLGVLALVSGSIATVIVLVLGQLHARANVADKVTLAEAAPAQVKVIGK